MRRLLLFLMQDCCQGAPEMWALGLRNPWRFSFDPQTGQPWVGDVGQGAEGRPGRRSGGIAQARAPMVTRQGETLDCSNSPARATPRGPVE